MGLWRRKEGAALLCCRSVWCWWRGTWWWWCWAQWHLLKVVVPRPLSRQTCCGRKEGVGGRVRSVQYEHYHELYRTDRHTDGQTDKRADRQADSLYERCSSPHARRHPPKVLQLLHPRHYVSHGSQVFWVGHHTPEVFVLQLLGAEGGRVG